MSNQVEPKNKNNLQTKQKNHNHSGKQYIQII